MSGSTPQKKSNARMLLMLLNIILFVSAFIFYKDEGGFYRSYWDSRLQFSALVMACSFINVAYLFFVANVSNPESLLSMWMRRRRLEEESKIKELESKNN